MEATYNTETVNVYDKNFVIDLRTETVQNMLGDEITTGTTEITFTPQAANFSSGSIEAVVWYEEATALANA